MFLQSIHLPWHTFSATCLFCALNRVAYQSRTRFAWHLQCEPALHRQLRTSADCVGYFRLWVEIGLSKQWTIRREKEQVGTGVFALPGLPPCLSMARLSMVRHVGRDICLSLMAHLHWLSMLGRQYGLTIVFCSGTKEMCNQCQRYATRAKICICPQYKCHKFKSSQPFVIYHFWNGKLLLL